VDFTRQPIIETVITPKEGCKLVVRSSKSSGQDEYFVDAVEVVSFGNSFFFRSLERPKSFLVPVSDYEVLEVREARMVLKNVGIDRSIKIGGGREAPPKTVKEAIAEKIEPEYSFSPESTAASEPAQEADASGESESKQEKKRDRRRHYRRRRGKDEALPKDSEESQVEELTVEQETETVSDVGGESKKNPSESGTTTALFSSLLPPPPTLISETIARYKDNAMFKGAFFTKEEKEAEANTEEEQQLLAETFHDDMSQVTVEEPPIFTEELEPFEIEETLSEEPKALVSEETPPTEEPKPTESSEGPLELK